MRKSDLKKNHEALDGACARYRAFMVRVIAGQNMATTAQERRDIAESVMLRLCANWEAFLDEHLVDCVNRDHTKLSDYFSVTIPTNPTWDLCHALVIGASYKDFKNLGALKGYTRKILPDLSNPFLAVSRDHADAIDEAYRIRNYLSHYSKASRKSLMKLYRETYGMTRFLEPGQFLLAYEATRLWRYFDAFEGASADMKGWY